MKTIKYVAKIRPAGSSGTPWDEHFEHPESVDFDEWIKATVAKFNDTLRPGEEPRELLSWKIEGDDTKHNWVKRTDGMSVMFRGSYVDLMTCADCGVTGKRYGLSDVVKIDSKYRAKRFQECGPRVEMT